MSACISPSDALLARRLIELTQAGLPLVADPWAWIAAQLRLSEAETLALLKRLRDAGVIRRIAAVPNHYRLGYRHNGMTVWDVADERIERSAGWSAGCPSSAIATGARAICRSGATTCSPWFTAAAKRRSKAIASRSACCSARTVAPTRCW